MITLYQFPPAWGLPNASPFCMKVETYLRMCNLPYTTVNVLNPAKGPKGKLPYITDGSNIVADSGLILDYLKKSTAMPWMHASAALSARRRWRGNDCWRSTFIGARCTTAGR